MIRDGKRFNKNRNALLFMALPLLIMVVLFNYVPLFGWSFAFFRYRPGIPLSETPFMGLHYFQMMIGRWSDVSRVLINTLALGGLSLLIIPFAMMTSVFLNAIKNKTYKRIVQTITIFPYFVSWIIVYALVFSLFSSQGMVNVWLLNAGIIERPLNVLGNADNAWLFQTSLSMWKFLGWNTIIYMAAIAGIDAELYEAARIDGAGRFRCTWNITLPGLLPAFAVLLILAVSNVLNQGFEQYLVFRNPQVAARIEVIDIYTYRLGLVTGDFSYATAIGMLKTVISISVLFTCNFILKKTRGAGFF